METRAGVLSMIVLAVGVVGCGNDSGRGFTPLSPTNVSQPSQQPTPVANVPLVSGIVTDTAYRPLAGATVSVVEGPGAGALAVTDGDGRYSLAGAFAMTNRFQGSKEGHQSVTGPLSSLRSAQLSFSLPQLQPPVSFAGAYSLTVTADSACTALPSALRTRTYQTTVRRVEPAPSVSTYFEVSIAGPTFLTGFTTAERFVGAIAGNDVRFWVGSDDGQPAFVEQLSETEYFAIGGASLVAVDSATSFAALLEGYVEYCTVNAPAVVPVSGTRYACGGANVVTRARCESNQHELSWRAR
jgi:hypothetical protein